MDPATHRMWIEHRARGQFDAGLVDEARGLRERFDPALPAFSAIGYREAWAVLDGKLSREAAIAEDARRNQAFAKRQRTWFRSEPDIEWLDATGAAARCGPGGGSSGAGRRPAGGLIRARQWCQCASRRSRGGRR